MTAGLYYIIPMQTGAYPEHPIVYPPPPGAPPGRPEHPIYYPPTVEHPIVIPPGVPPDQGLRPSHPIYFPPVHVEHPIPPAIWPSPPGPPPGGQTGSVSQPINAPPEALSSTGFWALTYYEALNGWVWVWVPIAAAPSEKKR